MVVHFGGLKKSKRWLLINTVIVIFLVTAGSAGAVFIHQRSQNKIHQLEQTLKSTDKPEPTTDASPEATDTSIPSLLNATTDLGTLSRYSVPQASSSSTSAKTGLKLLTNSKGPITLTLSFSEPVNPSVTELSTGESLQFSSAPAATVTGTLTASDAHFKNKLTFADPADNALLGELEYIYDNQPPKIIAYTDERVYDDTLNNFFITFSASEPLAFAKATVNGVTKTATGTYKGFRVDGLPLTTQDQQTIKIMGKDLAGNVGTIDVHISILHASQGVSDFPSLPANARHCTDEDKQICGYENVSDMTCDQFKVVKDCLHDRCSRDGFELGDCPL